MKTVRVGTIEIGSGTPKVCVPLTECDPEELFREAAQAVASGADLVEWRADYYLSAGFPGRNENDLPEVIRGIRGAIGTTPLLFTFRTFAQGGSKQATPRDYLLYNRTAIESGEIDLIDLEYTKENRHLQTLMDLARASGLRVILSRHDFTATPDSVEMRDVLMKMQEAGADIVKLAVMPQNGEDVFRLMETAKEMKATDIDRPFIAISMGEEGMASRVLAEMIGSAITYGSGSAPSAPGQMKANELSRILAGLHRKGLPARVFLIGFMGCGKSTVGKHLAVLLQYEFLDMDTLIEEREKTTIARIFEMEGEEVFRKKESRMLRELLTKERVVVACGGGVAGNSYTGEENSGLLAEREPVIYIKDSMESIFGRIAHDKGRPLTHSDLKDREEQYEKLAALLESRRPYYEKTASFTIDGEGKDPYAIAVEAIKLIATE